VRESPSRNEPTLSPGTIKDEDERLSEVICASEAKQAQAQRTRARLKLLLHAFEYISGFYGAGRGNTNVAVIRWDEKAGLPDGMLYAPKLSTCSKHR